MRKLRSRQNLFSNNKTNLPLYSSVRPVGSDSSTKSQVSALPLHSFADPIETKSVVSKKFEWNFNDIIIFFVGLLWGLFLLTRPFSLSQLILSRNIINEYKSDLRDYNFPKYVSEQKMIMSQQSGSKVNISKNVFYEIEKIRRQRIEQENSNIEAIGDHFKSIAGGRKDKNINNEKLEIMNEDKGANDFFLATSGLQDDFWGDGIASSWAKLPFPIDFQPVVVSLWVYLNSVTDASENRVIFTSKIDSCPSTPETAGMKLSIASNAGSKNRFLVFEYASRFVESSECLRFDTSDHQSSIPLDSWVQIGLVVWYSKEQNTSVNVKFYIDGVPIKIETGKQQFATNSEQKKISQGHITKLGQNFNGKDSLEGRLAMLALWIGDENIEEQSTDSMMRSIYSNGINEEEILKMGSQGFVKSPSLLYPLSNENVDSGSHSPLSKFTESVRGANGTIHRGVIRYYEPRGIDQLRTIAPANQQQLLFLRRLHIQTAMKNIWSAIPLGKDELVSLTRKGRTSSVKNGELIIDSMDTLWLMNLKDEFNEARDWVRDSLSFDNNPDVVSVSETTSRILGGLLSSFDLSSETVLLEKAVDLANRLHPAFSSSPSGIPYNLGHLTTSHYFNSVAKKVSLADYESLLLEFRRLSTILEKPVYANAVKKTYDVIAAINLPNDDTTYATIPHNLISDDLNNPKLEGNIKYFEHDGKLFFENLLKVYIQGGDPHKLHRTMYDQGVNYLVEKLLRKSKLTGLTYIADVNEKEEVMNKMDHSLCSFAGTLALGAYTHPLGIGHDIAQRDLRIGKELAKTCYNMYNRMKSGLSPETVYFNQNEDAKDETELIVPPKSSFYRLRSEFAESLFILYQLTHDVMYQEWGWNIFESIENYCRADNDLFHYYTLKDVNNVRKGLVDEMDSNFISKTMKYLYLLQDPNTTINVLKFVFNTRGHPIKTISNI